MEIDHLKTSDTTFTRQRPLPSKCTNVEPESERMWCAVYTLPNHERSLVKHLEIRQIESFLPTWASTRTWNNRQHVQIVKPLFPSYLFVRIWPVERSRVLQAPGALRIIGNCQRHLSVSDSEIEFLRSDFYRQRIEPYKDLIVGKRVCIKSGPMQGVRGTLVQKRNSAKFVVTIEMINQNAAIEVAGDEIEAVPN
jgi:transcription antitermination factor NusG